MKSVLLLLYFFSFIACASAQDNRQGFAEYKFTVPVKNPAYYYPKNAILYFNASESLFIYDKNGMDSIQIGNELKMDEDQKGAKIMVSPSDEKGKQIYRNFQNKKISFRETKKPPLDPFTVDDEWVEIHWNIKEEYKEIKNFNCQKAVGEFRGRTYNVWFTEEVPLPYGPWKLYGLPGLILEAEDEEKAFRVTFERLCYPCDLAGNKIAKPVEEENKNLREYVDFMDHLLKNVEKKMQSKLPKGKNISITLENPPNENEILEDRQYQIERQYEWEGKDAQ